MVVLNYGSERLVVPVLIWEGLYSCQYNLREEGSRYFVLRSFIVLRLQYKLVCGTNCWFPDTLRTSSFFWSDCEMGMDDDEV